MQHHHDYNFNFLKQKINEIKIALFKTEDITNELNLPNNIINTLKTDDDGAVWFFTAFKGYYEITKMMDKPFFAYLDYYKKGCDGHLHLSGKATIVSKDFGFFNISYPGSNYGVALIKMKIVHAEFYENKIPANVSWSQKVKYAINNLFISHPRVYNFS
ncbi:hypothetical protein [Ferruginibacter profundus]